MRILIVSMMATVCIAGDTFPLRSTEPMNDQAERVRALTEKIDPMNDDFPTERQAALAEQTLGNIMDRLKRIAGTDPRGDDWDGIPMKLAAAVTCRARLESVYGNGGIIVFRPNPKGPDGGCVDIMETLITGLKSDVDWDLRIFGVESKGDDNFNVFVVGSIWGASNNGLIQRNFDWSVSFEHSDIKDVELLRYEEVRMPGPVFADCTGSVIGSDDELLRRQLASGTDSWYGRVDRIAGADPLGHHGLAIGDVNRDGFEDVYFTQAGGLPNRLLVQKSDGSAEENAAGSGIDFFDSCRAALFVDMDNDGDEDLVISMRMATVVLENIGMGEYGVRLSAPTRMPSEFYSLAAIDYDNNRFLDVYSCRYIIGSYGLKVPLPYHDANNGPPNHLLKNLGQWNFADSTRETGLDVNNRRFSLAAAWEDYDNDGDFDLYVANDFGKNNLYRNDGVPEDCKEKLAKGEVTACEVHFTETGETSGIDDAGAGMGVSWADYDRDGFMDLYVSNMSCPAGARIMCQDTFRPKSDDAERALFAHHARGNSLFSGMGGAFEYHTQQSRVPYCGWSWGGMFMDLNNDGLEDLVVPNGNLTGRDPADLRGFFWRQIASRSPVEVKMDREYVYGWGALTESMNRGVSWSGNERNRTYLNIGNGDFADISGVSGFGYLDDARAVAITDWDQDGRLDMWVKNRTAPQIRFLRNLSNEPGHHIAFKLIGANGNRDAIGARLTLNAGGQRWIKTVRAGDGYLSQSSKRAHFGLGDINEIDSLEVRWPGGKTQTYKHLRIDNLYEIEEDQASVRKRAPRNKDAIVLKVSPLKPEKPDDTARLAFYERFPTYPHAELIGIDGQVKQLSEIQGQPYLMVLWQPTEDGIAQLQQLYAQQLKIEAAGAKIVAVQLGTPPGEGPDLTGLDDSLKSLNHYAAGELLVDFVDVMLQDFRGFASNLTIPATIVVDELGLVPFMYEGIADPDEMLQDLNRSTTSTRPYTGYWQFSAFMLRDFSDVAQRYRALGHDHAYREMMMIHRARTGAQRR